VCLVVGDSFLVVDAAVQGDVDTEGQESYGVLRSRCATRRPSSGSKGTNPIREVFTLCRLMRAVNQPCRRCRRTPPDTVRLNE
jgi:hypothetical protein